MKRLARSDHKKVMTYILIMALLGVFLVVWSNTNQTTSRRVSPPLEREEVEVGAGLEERLAKSLSLMEGVGRVEVHIYYSSNPRFHYSEDRRLQEKATLEEDSQGDTRQIREESKEYEVVILRDGSGGERPLIEEELKPHITGVLIVADGAQRAVVKDRIIRSVATLFQLPLYRIDVVSGKGGN